VTWVAVVLVWAGVAILVAAIRDGSPPGAGVRGEKPLPEVAPGPPKEDDVAFLTRLTQEKREVTGRLVAGRITLAEAAALFRDINARRPKCFPLFLEPFPGRTDEERVCRQVLAHVAAELSLSPGEPDPRFDCLEDDLAALLAPDSTIHLPPVSGE
jgi:hypothetical protein